MQRKIIQFKKIVGSLRQKLVSSSLARDFRTSKLRRAYAMMFFVLFAVSTLTAALQPFISQEPYRLDVKARNVLPESNPKLAEVLKYDAKKASFEYNEGYTGRSNPESDMDSSASPRFSASFSVDPTKGVVVNDPLSEVNVTMKPKFGLGQGKQEGNQVLYPLIGVKGYLVYTARVSSVKEDILLSEYSKDSLSYEYELGLEAGLEARLEKNGSIGIYGTDLPLMGGVSTGTDKDKELLDKARKNAKKTKLMFSIPAPVVVETDKSVSQVKAHFELDGNKVTLVAENLKGASYPLSIDPSVYIETAQKLMRGNSETNIDFDVSNELIQKGKLSGGRFDNWTNTMVLPASRWGHTTAVAGGYIYVVGGMDSSNTRSGAVYWAKFNETTGAIEAPNPGNGACANWCTNAAYNLPVALNAHAMVAYNGFLYVLGGESAAGRVNTVYVAKIGANGEPSLWHPTDTDSNNWQYWNSSTLSNERSYASAVAYNNRLYLTGGRTNAAAGGVNTVEMADITPTGMLGGWTTSGMSNIPSVRHMHNALVYNDRLYVLGGNSGGVVQSSVQYIRIANDGSLAGSWVTTTPMGSPRLSQGGNFATIWGGYIYVAGGCSAVAGAGDYCSVTGLSNARDIQIASINADGSIADWNNIIGISSPRMGYGFVAWRQNIYGIGGCTAQNETTGICTTAAQLTNIGDINPDGDVSTVNNSEPANASSTTCVGANPTNCDLPDAGDNAGLSGRMSMGVVINNGFIYVIGGCVDVTQTTTPECSSGLQMSGNISYATLAVDGTIVRATCTSPNVYGTNTVGGVTTAGTWCVDSTNRVNGTTGVGAMATAVFNNVMYTIGGFDGDTEVGSVFRVGLNDNGSLTGAWTATTFATAALGTARAYSYAFTRANPSSAGTNPGNLYVIGGCYNANTTSGIGCTNYETTVYKCNITTAAAIAGCTTTGQQQLDAQPAQAGAQGLGLMAGVVYANYIYLVGGSSVTVTGGPPQAERGEIMYAKINDSNNIVNAVTGTANATGDVWQTSPNKLEPVRRRGFAFGYNGYLYSLAGYSGSLNLNDLLYAKIDVSNGSISPFTTSFVTVNPRWDLKAIVANGYVYAIGGCSSGAAPSCDTMTGAVQTFQLYNNYSGSPAGYSATNTFGQDRIGGSATVLNGYIYYAGGCTTTACTTTTNNVYYAPLNPDGTIGAWTASPNSLPTTLAWGKLVAAAGTLYYVGGQTGAATTTAVATVYYSTPSSGVPAAWVAASNGLPSQRTEIGAAVWNDRIYVTGGVNNAATPARQNTVYASPQLTPGTNSITSAWVSTNGFNVARSAQVTIAYANNLYIFGGWDGTNYFNDVQFTQINSDGTVDAGWHYTTSLPQRIMGGDGFAANGYMYIFGGRSAAAAATTCTNNTYITPISANTTIVTGNNPTGIGEWSQTNVEYAEGRYGVAAAYDQGKAYVLGGGCTAPVAAANRGFLTALQAQPQVAKYSRMIDTDTDVFPTKWLMNGLDNSIGARWQLKYRSMTNPLNTDPATMCASAAMSTWGQETNYGTVNLGTPDNYIPKDGAGTNTNCARYFYLSVSIDSSQAFGYPEDVERGPTINDISLFFTSDPSRRLRHGKTFTGGLLQPLDTPFP
ncbi:MAG: hypothetical protein JWP13_809 [Candidatus Saccharibacteria bacterium]|nr:hypothetical protein [Candidatus Saccharibacteria bacterium]